MSERLCVFCKNLKMGNKSYSGTMGMVHTDFKVECSQKLFPELKFAGVKEFRGTILKAEKCGSYVEAK